MKHITFILALLLILAACGRQEKLTIHGEIENGSGEMLYFYRMDLNGDVLIDSSKIRKNESFSFNHPRVEEPTFFKLALSPNRFIPLLADSSEQITVYSQKDRFATSYTIENSEASSQVQMLTKRIARLKIGVDSIINLYNSLPENEQEEQLEPLSNELSLLIDNYKKETGEFIMENPRSFASYYALFLTMSDDTQVLNVMDKDDQVYFATIATSLNILYPESPRVRQLYDFVLNVKAEERRAQMINALEESEGTDLPEIVQQDVDGNDIALSSLRGNVILLSFWASWDDASRRENRNLRRLYQQYNNRGFEIYQVGLERSRLLWENAINQDEITWTSVTDLQYTDGYAARVYNIQRLPANYLINRDGEIIGKDLFGARLEEKLQEVL